MSELPIEAELRAHQVNDGVCLMLRTRDSEAWLQWCDRLLEEGQHSNDVLFTYGVLLGHMKSDWDSFLWALYQISRVEGYEELICRFHICAYQRHHPEIAEGVES